MKHLSHLLLGLVLLAGCAILPSFAYPTQTEELWWVDTDDGMFRAAIAEMPDHKQVRSVGPWGTRELYDVPGRKALDRKEFLAAAKNQVERIFANLPIKVVFGGEKPEDCTRVAVIRVTAREGRLGSAKYVDIMNRHDEHEVEIYLSELIHILDGSPARTDDDGKYTPVPAHLAGALFGTILAHEIAHTIGLRHRIIEGKTDWNYLMTSSLGEGNVAKIRLHPHAKVYLWCMLSGIEIPEWITVHKDDGGNPPDKKPDKKSGCTLCGG